MAKRTVKTVSKKKSARPVKAKTSKKTAKPKQASLKAQAISKTKPASSKANGLVDSWTLTKTTAQMLYVNRELFIKLSLAYGLLNLLLVQGLASSSDVVSLKGALN